jgi:hypothetical protein
MVEVHKARALTSRILEMAKSNGTVLKSYEVATDHLKVVEAHAGSANDITGIYGAVRLESGLPFKNAG